MGQLKLLVALVLVVLPAGVGNLAAQQAGNDLGTRFGARVVTLYQDSYTGSDSWRPGAEMIVRLPLAGVLAAELAVSNARTRRWDERPCPDEVGFTCPPGKEVSGWAGTAAALVEANLVLDSYLAYSGVGYGRMWESQSAGMFEYGGPIWTWAVGVERRVGRRLAVDLGYKFVRMTWDNEYGSALQGVHMNHHQLAFGITFAPWSQRSSGAVTMTAARARSSSPGTCIRERSGSP